jgi:hypothetical protein
VPVPPLLANFFAILGISIESVQLRVRDRSRIYPYWPKSSKWRCVFLQIFGCSLVDEIGCYDSLPGFKQLRPSISVSDGIGTTYILGIDVGTSHITGPVEEICGMICFLN